MKLALLRYDLICLISFSLGFVLTNPKEAQSTDPAGDQNQQLMRRLDVPKIKIIKNVAYADTDNPRQQVDLFLPNTRTSDTPLPVIAFVHGGGWRKGSRRSGLQFLAPLVSTGEYLGVSIGYRLTDEATWPAQIHDCKAAIRWLRANAKTYHADPTKIIAVGTSAGGHLVAMLGTSGDVLALEGQVGSSLDNSSRVTGVIDFFGPTNLTSMGGFHNNPDSPESLLLGGPVPELREIAAAASPITYVTKDDPPFLMIHGSDDKLVPFDQSVQLHKSLQDVGVSARLIEIEGGGHGRLQSKELDSRIRLFLENQFRDSDHEISTQSIPGHPSSQDKNGRN